MADNDPYDLEGQIEGFDSGGGGGGGNGPDNDPYDLVDQFSPEGASASAQQQYDPDEVTAQDIFRTDLFGQFAPEQMVGHYGLYEKVLLKDADSAAAFAVRDTMDYWTLIYGEKLAPVMQAALDNPLKYKMLQRLLAAIAQQDMAPMSPRGPSQSIEQMQEFKDVEDKTILLTALQDPTYLDQLPAPRRNQVITLAQEAQKTLESQGHGLDQQWVFRTIAGQTLAQNYDVFLSSEEKEGLDRLVERFGTKTKVPTHARGPNPQARLDEELADLLGVASIENPGEQNKRIVLDDEWARARPIKAAAVMDALRSRWPDIQIQVGEDGIVGEALDALSTATDIISIPVAWGMGSASGTLDELLEKNDLSDEDRAQAKQKKAELQAELRSGEVPVDKIEEQLRKIRMLDDLSSIDYGYSWSEAVDNGFHPKHAGTALGDSMLESVDLRAGDPGTEWAYAASNLFQGIVFDPLNVAFPLASGARLGRRVVAGAGEAKGVVDTTLDTFRVAPTAQDLENAVTNGRHAIVFDDAEGLVEATIKGRFPNAKKVSLRRGGKVQDAWLVPNMNPEEAIHVAQGAGQTEVITREGLIDVSTRQTRPIKKVYTGADTALRDDTVMWGLNNNWAYEFGNSVKLRPPRISTSWLRQRAFQAFVKSPEDWVRSPYVVDAAKRIIEQGKRINDVDEYAAWIQRVYGLDPVQARVFAQATSEEQVLHLFYESVTGGMDTTMNSLKFIDRISELAKRLDKGDDLRLKVRKLETQPQTELVSKAELDELHADLTDGAHRTGMFATDAYPNDVRGALAKRVKVASPGRIDDITELMSPYEQSIFRQELQRLRIKKGNVINAPKQLKVADVARGGRFFTKFPTRLLRDRGLVDDGVIGIRDFPDVPGPGGKTPGEAYQDDLVEYVRANGLDDFDEPIQFEILPNGKIAMADGTHRVAAAERLGLDEVPVQISTGSKQAAARVYEWLQEHAPETLRQADPLPDDLAKLAEESELLKNTRSEMEALEATRVADASELAYLRSISNGRIWKVPIRKMPTRSLIRRTISKSMDSHPSVLGLRAMADFAEKGLPLHLMRNLRLGTARVLGGKEFFESEKAADRFLHWMGSFTRSHGGGSAIDMRFWGRGALFDESGLPIRLVDTDIEVMDNLRNMARNFGLKTKDIDKLVGAFVNAKGLHARYAAYSNYWETIADISPGLGAVQRAEVRRWANTEIFSRNPGFVNDTLANGLNDATPTHWTVKTSPDGSKYRVGRPVITADALSTVHMPDIEKVIDWISFNRRLNAAMRQGNMVQKAVGGSLSVVHSLWQITNQSIKTLLLLAKMPFALPLRIIGEEHLRMAAFDQATMFNHPIEWMQMALGKAEFNPFTVTKTEMLGLLHEQFQTYWRQAAVGRRQVAFGFDDAWYDAFNTRLLTWAKSPEVGAFYVDNLDDPGAVLAALESPAGRARGTDDILDMWDESFDPSEPLAMQSRDQAVRQALKEAKQLIGTGPAAERIRLAMKDGRYVDENGKVFELGSREFTQELRRLVDEGLWQPQAKVLATTEKEYAHLGEKLQPMRDLRDKVFEVFYTGQDAALARRPLFRGLARKEYDRLTSVGWRPERAKHAAEAYAYRRTADMLYRIGETTSGHHFARNIAPFLPAFQELTTTWLYRIPKELGAGWLAPGYLRLARKADVWFTFLKQAGVVEVRTIQNQQTGEMEKQYIVPVPGLGQALSAIFNLGPGVVAEANLESFTGILPDPTKGFAALIPSLGSPTSYILGEFANNTDIADDFIDALLPFGREATVGPTGVNRLWTAAFGSSPPWEGGTADYQDYLINSSIDDGIRIAFTRYGKEMPKREDFAEGEEGEDAYVQAHRDWADKILREGEKWSTVRYASRGMGSFYLPFTFDITTKQANEMEAIWQLINVAPGSEKTLASPILQAFRETYPGAVWYSNGKTINLAPDRAMPVGDPWFDSIKEGFREQMTPEEYIKFSVGMNSYYVYLNKRSNALRDAGTTPVQILTHGYGRKVDLARIDGDWEAYLALSEEEDPTGGARSFADLFDLYQSARDDAAERGGYGFDPVVEDQIMLDVKTGLQRISRLFTENGIRDGDYKKILAIISDATSGITYPEARSEVGRAIAWWYDEVSSPYYEQVGKLYDQINVTEGRLRGPLYEQLRQLSNSQERTMYRGMVLPTPEEVAWGNLSAQEQEVRVVEWAKLPPEWLTSFQVKKVGIKGDVDKMDELFTYINTQEMNFRIATQLLSPQSNDYQAARESYDNAYAQKAADLGLTNVFQLSQAMPFVRIDFLLGDEFKNKSWDTTIQYAVDIHQRLAAADIAPAGSTETARANQINLVNRVEALRQSDPEFRALLDRVKYAFIPTGKEDMGRIDFYWKFYFDGFLDSAPGYLVYDQPT